MKLIKNKKGIEEGLVDIFVYFGSAIIILLFFILFKIFVGGVQLDISADFENNLAQTTLYNFLRTPALDYRTFSDAIVAAYLDPSEELRVNNEIYYFLNSLNSQTKNYDYYLILKAPGKKTKAFGIPEGSHSTKATFDIVLLNNEKIELELYQTDGTVGLSELALTSEPGEIIKHKDGKQYVYWGTDVFKGRWRILKGAYSLQGWPCNARLLDSGKVACDNGYVPTLKDDISCFVPYDRFRKDIRPPLYPENCFKKGPSGEKASGSYAEENPANTVAPPGAAGEICTETTSNSRSKHIMDEKEPGKCVIVDGVAWRFLGPHPSLVKTRYLWTSQELTDALCGDYGPLKKDSERYYCEKDKLNYLNRMYVDQVRLKDYKKTILTREELIKR